jgi:hypothetical protein
MDLRLAEVKGDEEEIASVKAKRDAFYGIMETITPQLEAAGTPEELMAIWPEGMDNRLKPELWPVEKVNEIRAERAAKRAAKENANGNPDNRP